MGLRRVRDHCYAEAKPCTGWVLIYFKDCLCNLRDYASFGLGLLSVSCWAFAEVPQIITNFKAKSSQGVSPMLLLTWILGDLFNLVGCYLEPSTLPTQFYTALLYTVGSLMLMGQCTYYDYVVPWLMRTGKKDCQVLILEEDLIAKPLLNPESKVSSKVIDLQGARPVPKTKSPAYYMFVYAYGEHDKYGTTTHSGSLLNRPRKFVAGYGTFIAAASSLPNQTGAINQLFLKNYLLKEDDSDPYGQMMGWGMATIYIFGRIPQIWLNMKRGNVEGLSPLMFIFALMGNFTYILSILVRSCKWHDVKANIPWLLDAAFCISLDLFILIQFAFYKYKKSKMNKQNTVTEAPDI